MADTVPLAIGGARIRQGGVEMPNAGHQLPVTSEKNEWNAGRGPTRERVTRVGRGLDAVGRAPAGDWRPGR